MTFVSATGQYGWLEYSARKPYYVMIAAGYLALLAVYAWAVVRSRDVAARLTYLLVSVFAALSVAAAIHQSWVNDFQAQGRYLFPIAAMLGIGLQAVRNKMEPRVVTGVVACCFALSVWSFTFIGLWHIPKSF
jgi:glucan phosphoethanolaminetransferase (alkaline phosphatase superfamily)